MPRGKLLDGLTLGSYRRRRHMHRRLRELDRWYAAEAAGRSRGSRREGARRVLVGVATLAISVPASLTMLHQQGIDVDLHSLTRRIGIGPASAEEESGPYRFMRRQPGGVEPVAYDPCRPIHVVRNLDVAPPGSSDVLDAALEEVSKATGMTFVDDGATDELPGDGRPTRDPARYGAGWSPVLVAWTTPEQDPGLAGRVVGLGGSTSVADTLTERRQYVTGTVSLDAPALARITRRPGRGPLLARAVVMHELAHVLGLSHVRDRGELMYDGNVGRLTFGPGDRRGLALLGRAACTG
jgi:hypothetical protein